MFDISFQRCGRVRECSDLLATHRLAASSARVMADVDSEMHDAAAGGAGSAELHQRTIRVLVVEDDPFSVTVLQHLFAKITQGAERIYRHEPRDRGRGTPGGGSRGRLYGARRRVRSPAAATLPPSLRRL